jgi:DNA primase
MSKSLGYIDFAFVKASVTLEQVLTHYGVMETLKPQGGSLRGCCPIHKGDDPKQFSVTLERNIWQCFSQCKHGGSMLEFVMYMENCSSLEAAWKLNDWFELGQEKKAAEMVKGGKLVPKSKAAAVPSPATATPPPAKTLAKPIEPESEMGENEPNEAFNIPNLDTSHPYFAERGLTAETVAHFGLGYCAKGIMAGRIAIPIHNAAGQIVANAGRWPGEPPEGKEKYRLPGKFKKLVEVYNYHRATLEPDTSPLVIVEGFFAVHHLWQLGLRRVVALMGWHLGNRQEELIAKLVTPESRIVLMLDNDDAGITARHKISPRFAEHCFVRSFRWPEQCHQPDELTEDHVAELLD